MMIRIIDAFRKDGRELSIYIATSINENVDSQERGLCSAIETAKISYVIPPEPRFRSWIPSMVEI